MPPLFGYFIAAFIGFIILGGVLHLIFRAKYRKKHDIPSTRESIRPTRAGETEPVGGPRRPSEAHGSEGSADAGDIAALIEPLRRPALVLETSDEPSRSSFGGRPPDHRGFEWPTLSDGRPLDFIACIDLAEVEAATPALDWLPKHGRLLFFYDVQEQPWGLDPDERECWTVLHVAEDQLTGGEADPPDGLDEEVALTHRHIRYRTVSQPPSWDRREVAALNLTNEQRDGLNELWEAVYGDEGAHQIGGYPNAVQDPNMEIDCEQMLHLLRTGEDSVEPDSPEAEAIRRAAEQWRLLLQVDSDDEINAMWGDVGVIYFWVREAEARRGDFSNAWLLLQGC